MTFLQHVVDIPTHTAAALPCINSRSIALESIARSLFDLRQCVSCCAPVAGTLFSSLPAMATPRGSVTGGSNWRNADRIVTGEFDEMIEAMERGIPAIDEEEEVGSATAQGTASGMSMPAIPRLTFETLRQHAEPYQGNISSVGSPSVRSARSATTSQICGTSHLHSNTVVAAAAAEPDTQESEPMHTSRSTSHGFDFEPTGSIHCL